MDPSYYNQMFPGGTGGYGGGYGGGNQVGAQEGGSDNGSGGGMPSWLSSLTSSGMMGGMGSLLSGLFGNAGSPYGAAGNAYNKYAQMGAGAISPYAGAGAWAIPGYEKYASSMANPSQFINTLMNSYNESPTAKYMQQQALRSATNEGSAAGTVGSTPYTLQNEQNAENISQQDMGNWLNNVLGVNTQYGSALGNMMNTGEQGANALLGLYGQEAGAQGEAAYGEAQGQNQDQGNTMMGILGMIPSLASMF